MLLFLGWRMLLESLLPFKLRRMGLSTYPLCIGVPWRLLDPCPIQPPPCIPGVVQSLQEHEESAMAVGVCARSACARHGPALLLPPSSSLVS